jgi:transposase
MFTQAAPLRTDETQRQQLMLLAKSGKTPQRLAIRARIALLAADGESNCVIAREVGVSRPTVIECRRLFMQRGVEGLTAKSRRRRRQKGVKLTAEREARLVKETLETKPPDADFWSTRDFARRHGLSHTTIHRLWNRYRLQPHRVERFKISNDPEFDDKVRDIVGLYLNPPDKALVLCVDEKSQIQALDRTQPLLPMRPGLPERQTHDYERHGTTCLFAAFNILDGKTIAQCLPRHRSKEFIKFLTTLESSLPGDLDLHLIMDNYGTHKGPAVHKWLSKKSRRRFHFHFTPTSSSWLNQVERWFGEITRKKIRRGTFTSVDQLEHAIYQYLAEYGKNPKPFRWVATAEAILAKVDACKKLRVTGH